jgi:predicted membrane-bound spermidine synthase
VSVGRGVAENQSGGLSRLAAGLAAFAAGWVVMSLQLLGGRLMAPSFGQTIHQWGALIGATLAAMTLGYWLASRWGARALPGLLAVGALWAGLTPWLGREVCAWAEQALGPVAGSLAAAFVLMGPPGFALAAVSPLCVALLARGGSVAGASGLVSALGALGSIGGTFYGAFLAIPLLGLAGGYASAAVLAAAAALAAGLAWRHVVLALVPLVPAVMAQRDFAADFLELRETPYNTIMVSQVPGGLVLALNSPHVMQSLRRHDGGPTGYYWDVLAAVPALARGHSALFLGVAGGTAVEQTLHAWPGLQAVGVEIDPAVIEVARRRFGLSIPVVAADARRFVAEPGPRFDVIVIDLYATGQIPAHVATREFYEAVARRLAPGGVVALNVYGAGDPATVVGPVAAALAAVFPGVLAADAGGGNVILLAWAEAMDLATARSLLAVVPLPAAERLLAGLALPDPGWERVVLTDDRSDLEIRAAKALARK